MVLTTSLTSTDQRAFVAGTTIAAWTSPWRDGFELFCVDHTARVPSGRKVSQTGVAEIERPVHADGDMLLWTDKTGTPQWVRGCAGTAEALPIHDVLGLAYPEVFHAEQGRIRVFNLETGRDADLAALPRFETFAGNGAVVAWANNGQLTVLDRRSGTQQTMTMRRPAELSDTVPGRLTAGDRLVAFGMRLPKSELEHGFVYDPVTGESSVVPTETLAHGDRLLWREGTGYVVAPIRLA